MAKQKITAAQNAAAAIRLSATANTGTSTATTTVALSNTDYVQGNGLTKSGNSVLVGKGVNYVRATACITYEAFSTTATYAFCYLRKNTTNMTIALEPATAGFAFMNLATSFPVVEGDTISIAGDVGSGTATFSGSTRPVHLCVEALG